MSDAVFDALSDATRRRIVERLRSGPLPVGEIAAELPVGRPAVSRHLKVLEGAGLVEHHSVGTRNLYAPAPPGFTALQQWLAGMWTTAAAGRHVGRRVEGPVRTASGSHREPAADPPPDRGPGRARRGARRLGQDMWSR